MKPTQTQSSGYLPGVPGLRSPAAGASVVMLSGPGLRYFRSPVVSLSGCPLLSFSAFQRLRLFRAPRFPKSQRDDRP